MCSSGLRGSTSSAAFLQEADQDLDTDDLTVEHDQFDEIVFVGLANRIPAFEAVKIVGSWAGFYDYNTLDQNGIVGRHPEVETRFSPTASLRPRPSP